MWLKKLASVAQKTINQVSRVASILAVVFLLIMMALTVTDVFLRSFFNSPILGSMEITEYLIVVAGFLGLAWCAAKRGHLKVDMIMDRLSPRAQEISDSITMILALTVVPLVAWQCFEQAQYTLVEGNASAILHIPDYIFYNVAGVGYALLSLVLLTILADSIGKVIKR